MELQICPFVQKLPNRAHSTALSTSASPKTSRALFPPSSSPAGLRFLAADKATRCPVAQEPVNATLAMRGSSLCGLDVGEKIMGDIA